MKKNTARQSLRRELAKLIFTGGRTPKYMKFKKVADKFLYSSVFKEIGEDTRNITKCVWSGK